MMVAACRRLVQKRKASGQIPAHFPEDQACALALYSAGWANASDSFYHVMNRLLRMEDRSQVKKFYAVLRLMCAAMESLKPHVGTLYRGVKSNLASKYPVGERVVWWAWSSCTTAIDVLHCEEFLGQVGQRTLLIIEGAVGFDIRAFSWFQNESEVLLPAGTEVLVKHHLDAGNGLTMITLQMVQTTQCIMDLNKRLPSGKADAPLAAPGALAHDCAIEGLAAILNKAKLAANVQEDIKGWCNEMQAAK